MFALITVCYVTDSFLSVNMFNCIYVAIVLYERMFTTHTTITICKDSVNISLTQNIYVEKQTDYRNLFKFELPRFALLTSINVAYLLNAEK